MSGLLLSGIVTAVISAAPLVVACASVKGLYSRRAEFLRTPEDEERGRVVRAVTANLPETICALLGIGGVAAALTHGDTLAGTLTAALLLLTTWAFLSPPWNSLAARRTARPAHAGATVGSR